MNIMKETSRYATLQDIWDLQNMALIIAWLTDVLESTRHKQKK